MKILAPMTGTCIPSADVPDPVFANDMLGKGIAIDPTAGLVVAPFDGEVTLLFKTLHALCIKSAEDADVLVHIGIDTVRLEGKGFKSFVQQGDRVAAGQPLVKMNLLIVRMKGLSPICPVIVANHGLFSMKEHYGPCTAGKTPVIELVRHTDKFEG